MMFSPGDLVHLPRVGTGIVRQLRGGGRYAVEIKGRVVIAQAEDLELVTSGRRQGPPTAARVTVPAGVLNRPRPSKQASALDLHGRTVAEALELVDVFLNDALLDGQREAHIIHGRGGGKIKIAVHRHLRQIASVASFHLDPQNPGVTIVMFS